jgi:hypothetical protein
MMKGVEVLKNLQVISGETTEVYTYQNCNIKNSSLVKGIDLYNIVINKFLGNSLINRLKLTEFKTIDEVRKQLNPDTNKGFGEWIDLSGLIAPKNEIDDLLNTIEKEPVTLDEIQSRFETMDREYYSYEWTWAKQKLEEYWKKTIEEVTAEDIVNMVESWKTSVVKLDQLIYNDAKKEFDLNSRTGFGVDGNEEQKHQDFESVRGSFESNTFVTEVLNHIKTKTELGNELINRLSKINQKSNKSKV